jgi:hypothetical protein
VAIAGRRSARSDSSQLRQDYRTLVRKLMRPKRDQARQVARALLRAEGGLKKRRRAMAGHNGLAMVMLQLALTWLARHYELEVTDRMARRRRGIRPCRPTLNAWIGPSDQ